MVDTYNNWKDFVVHPEYKLAIDKISKSISILFQILNPKKRKTLFIQVHLAEKWVKFIFLVDATAGSFLL